MMLSKAIVAVYVVLGFTATCPSYAQRPMNLAAQAERGETIKPGSYFTVDQTKIGAEILWKDIRRAGKTIGTWLGAGGVVGGVACKIGISSLCPGAVLADNSAECNSQVSGADVVKTNTTRCKPASHGPGQ